MSIVRAEIWYRVRLFASRSYQFSAWPVGHEQGTDAPALGLSIFSDDAGTSPAVPAPTSSSTALEGSTNSNGDVLPASMLFQPTTTGVYKFRILRTSGGTTAHSINVVVRDTTLFSPWTSKAAGFEGFIEMHNNTNAALSVTLRAFNNAGTLEGPGLTMTLQPNATDFKTATQVGVPVNVFAGIVLTHNGAFGAVAANITTLNAANGLSFDSPFTPRSSRAMLGKRPNFQGAAPPTVTTGVAGSVTKTMATLGGTVSDNNAVTAVTFDYGLTTGYGTNAPAMPTTVAAGAGSSPVVVSATGLTCGSTYHFRAVGANALGTTLGSDQTFDTVSCAATAPATTTNAATAVGLSGATLNGTVNDNLATTTVTFEYGPTVAYGTTAAATPGTVAAGAGNTAVSVNLAGLTCGTTYHFRVKGVNILGAASGGDLSFTTSTCVALTAHPRLWLSEAQTLPRLSAAAVANSTEWVRLKSFCDTKNLTTFDYQGEEAYRHIANFSLCYRIVKALSGAAAAAPYAQKGLNVLQDPANPVLTFTAYSTDSGYGIRNYVPAMAVAYDWLFDSPLMTGSIRSAIIAQLNNWLNWYAADGYSNADPIANYNAGYTTSSVLAAIAINGEDASAAAMFTGAVARFNAAQQLFDQKMPGGHWPEGWNYGPLVYQSHLMAASALKSFTGAASYVTGKSWMSNNVPFKLQAMTPDGAFFYDDGLWSGDGWGDVRYSDIAAAGFVYGWASTNGHIAKRYIDIALAGGAALVEEEWKGFLLYDPTAVPADLVSLPRSHLAQGLGLAVMRSDWSSPTATWATAAVAGQYLSYQDEQDQDQGHMTLYKGAPLLIDAGHNLYTEAASLNTFLHNTFTMEGRTDGFPYPNFSGSQLSYSQECPNPLGTDPIGNNAFIDGGEYLFTSGEFSAAYQTNPQDDPYICGRVPVSWTNRSVFYLRPDVLVVYDQIRKVSSGPGGSQLQVVPTQHWHFPTTPTQPTPGSNRKLSIDNGTARLHFETVFPAATTSTVVNEAVNTADYPGVANSHLTVTYSGSNPQYQKFLTVMRAGQTTPSYTFPTVTAITGTNAFGSLISGLLPAESATPIVVAFADNGLLTFPTSISYQYTSAVATRNFVMKLKPNQIYNIAVSFAGSTVTVTLAESGTGTSTDSAGVLAFNP